MAYGSLEGLLRPLATFGRQIIPEPHNRQPLTLQALPRVLTSYLPFVLLAYLSRRTDTYVLRLLLLPIVLWTVISTPYSYFWTIPSLNVYNWAQCLLAEVLVAKSLDFALNPDGMLKVGECRPGLPKGKEAMHTNGYTKQHTEVQRSHILPKGLMDAIEVIHTMRGLKWKFSAGVAIPKEYRPQDRVGFLKETFKSFIRDFLLLDFVESTIKLFPGVGTTDGGSMFYSQLPPVQRYAVSTVIHTMTGIALLTGFGFVYNLITILAVGILGDDVAAWPPEMDKPWRSHSLHEFWAKRWHQFLRRTFVVLGGYPGKWIAGDIGMLLGVFLASGLFHECGMYAMGRGMDHIVTLFFTSQALLLVLERIWSRVTGHRVSGIYGRLWVYSVMFIGAQPVVDTWYRRGLGGGMVIPPFLSPTKLLYGTLHELLTKRNVGSR